MLRTSNSPETLFRVVMWIISGAFAWFLVGLGGIIISDLPKVEHPIRVEDFEDQALLKLNTAQQEQVRTAASQIFRERELDQQAVSRARTAYLSEQESFRNWLALRGITKDNTQNPEVVERARHLEALKGAQREAQVELERIEGEQLQNQQESNRLYERAQNLSKDAQKPFDAARRRQELSVFGIRLLFTMPLLAVGAWAVRGKRASKYWPLWRGFIGFALFSFFFELVPYLPSYGGYVRYIVGIVLTILAGHYVIKWMQAYLERRKDAEKQTEISRRASMDRDAALRKMAANLCPSCERPVFMSNGQPASFCVHCGLSLYSECAHCHARMNSFFAHCGTCGNPMPKCEVAESGPVPPVIT